MLRFDADSEEGERQGGRSANRFLPLRPQLKLEWHRAGGSKTRCLRITQKEEKVVRQKLQAKCVMGGQDEIEHHINI